jgi:TonB family protein
MANLNNDIEKYLRGELTPSERHALEQKALLDPFLAEALEGAEQAGPEHFAVDLQMIKKSLHEKTKSRRRFIDINGWQWYSGIAAGLLLFALCTYTVIMMIGQQRKAKEIAQLEQKVVTDTITSSNNKNISEAEESKKESDAEESGKKVEEENKTLALKEKHDEEIRRREDIAMNDRAKSRNAIGSGTLPRSGETPSQKPDSPDTSRIETETQPITEIAEAPVIESREGIASRDDDDEVVNKAEAIRSEQYETKSAVRKKSTAAASETVQPSTADLSGKLSAETLIKGRVTGEGEGLPGVNVVVKGTALGTVTNASGEYMISVPAGYSTLSFMFIGLVSNEVPIASATNGILNIEMTPDVTQLSEVVVTGYGVSNSDKTYPTFEMAMPEVGRRDFKKYLEDNVKYPSEASTKKIEGRVTVQFTVLANGQLTDFKVIKGIGGGCEEELIRVIKNGPRWVPSKQTGRAVNDQIKVRYRFDLP